MGEMYLSSRTEVLRSMNIDTGRKVAIVGAPEDFIVWMNNILPLHTRVAGSPLDIGTEPKYDIILLWTPEGVGKPDIEILDRCLSENGDLWVMIKRGAHIDVSDRINVLDKGRTLMITPTMDLIPLIIRSIKS